MCHTFIFLFFSLISMSLWGLFFKLKPCLAVAELCLFSLGFFRCFLLGTWPCFVLGFLWTEELQPSPTAPPGAWPGCLPAVPPSLPCGFFCHPKLTSCTRLSFLLPAFSNLEDLLLSQLHQPHLLLL